jgi:hypothetical protein
MFFFTSFILIYKTFLQNIPNSIKIEVKDYHFSVLINEG